METAKDANVINMPLKAREIIETAMDVFLYTGSPRVRDIMLNTIKMELIQSGLTRLHCNKFRVWLWKGNLVFDTTNISTDDKCKCGTNYMACTVLYVHQGLHYDEQIYGCKCGHIFKIAHRKGD